jgi:hypothetical protein
VCEVFAMICGLGFSDNGGIVREDVGSVGGGSEDGLVAAVVAVVFGEGRVVAVTLPVPVTLPSRGREGFRGDVLPDVDADAGVNDDDDDDDAEATRGRAGLVAVAVAVAVAALATLALVCFHEVVGGADALRGFTATDADETVDTTDGGLFDGCEGGTREPAADEAAAPAAERLLDGGFGN